MKLNPAQTLDAAVRALTQDLLATTRDRLVSFESPDDDVHQARKSMKKLRAVLRAIRPALSEWDYRRANGSLRDLARELSPYRESAVLAKTLKAIRKQFSDLLTKEDIRPLIDALDANHQARIDALRVNPTIPQCIASMEAIAESVASWPTIESGHILEGIARNYRRGRREFAVAQAEPTTAHLHQWRKRVKYLWYHVCMFEPAWSKLLAPLNDHLRDLSELIGEDHDLADFSAHVINGSRLHLSTDLRDQLTLAIAARRDDLSQTAFAMARPVYALRPRELAPTLNRMGLSWS